MNEYLPLIAQALGVIVPVCGAILGAAKWLVGRLAHIEKIPDLITAFNDFKKESMQDFAGLSNRVFQVERDLKEALDVRREVAELRAEILLMRNAK